MTSIKETPESKCEKWRDEYYQAMVEKCNECQVLINECADDYPEEYRGVFNQKEMNFSYIYKPYTYPEVAITTGISNEIFEQICEMEKSSFDKAVCVR